MTVLLAAGVFGSGLIKDLLCLPRPLSPPLTRITMSGSAALEYGFPSSHSTNAVSVAVLAIMLLRNDTTHVPLDLSWYLQLIAYFYMTSIVVGRLYCGMHGFFDVVFGSLLGVILAVEQYYLGPLRDEWLLGNSIQPLLISSVIILILVRIHPEPADDCPCFDDSVAFMGVVLGIDLGCYSFASTGYADATAVLPYTIPFDLRRLGVFRVLARTVAGVLVVFSWRAVMKPTLLRTLPPIFRVVEKYDLDLPRRFFQPASQYKEVPTSMRDNDLIPSPRDIPEWFNNLRRRRAVSVGPQSEADAYEALAYRQQKRRDSIKSVTSQSSVEHAPDGDHHFESVKASSHGRKRSLSVEEFRAQMGSASPEAGLDKTANITNRPHNPDFTGTDEDEHDRKELFANVQRPRVRYDVEVVTKLIVYTGIGWLSVAGAPIIFHHVGLGVP